MSEGEIDAHLVLEAQIINLGEQNEELRKENGRMRAQFEKALKMVSQLDSLTDSNRRLKDDLSSTRLEKDDLIKRIEIVSKAKEELEFTLRNERQAFSESLRSEIQCRENEISKIKLNAKHTTEQLQFELEKANKDREEMEAKLKRMELESQKLVSSARRYFNIDFRSFDSLCEFFDRPPEAIGEKKEKRKLLQKGKPKDSGRLELVALENMKLEDEVSRLTREVKRSEHHHASVVKQLKRSFQIEIEDRDLRDSSKDHKIQALENQVSKLREELKQQQSMSVPVPVAIPQQQSVPVPAAIPQQQSMSVPVVIRQEPEQPVIKYVKNTEEIALLEGRIDELLQELSVWKDKCSALEGQTKKVSNGSNETQQSFDQMKSEYVKLQQVYQSKLDTIKQMNDEKESELMELKKEQQKSSELQEKLTVLQASSEAQARRLKEILAQKEQNAKELKEQESLVEKLQKEVEKQVAITGRLRSERDLHKNERCDVAPAGQERPLSPSVLKSNVFDQTLSEMIDQIAMMDNIESTAKIQNIYKTIHKYFVDKLSECEQSLQLKTENNDILVNRVSQFLSNLVSLLSIKPVSLDDLLTDDGAESILAAVTELKAAQESAKKTSDWLKLFVGHFQKSFKLESTDDCGAMLTQVNDLKGVLDSQAHKLAKRTKQCRELREICRLLEDKISAKARDIESLSQDMESDLGQAQAKAKEYLGVIRSQKRKISSLKSELKEVTGLKTEMESVLRDQQQKFVSNSSRVENELHDKVTDLTEKNNDLQRRCIEADAKISKLKEQLRAQHDTIMQKEAELNSFEKESQERQETLSNDWQSERETTKRNYESAIASLKEQCESHRNDITKISTQLRNAKKDRNVARMKVSQLQSECDRLQHEINLKSEQIERAKKLAESTSKAQLLSIESDWTAKFDEERARHENEKRRLFTFIVDQFRQFFNPQEAITEATLKSVVMKARDTLARLLSSQ